MNKTLVRKLRIYAMVMRFQELEKERIAEISRPIMKLFPLEPIGYELLPERGKFHNSYKKKVNLSDQPKSRLLGVKKRYQKAPKNPLSESHQRLSPIKIDTPIKRQNPKK